MPVPTLPPEALHPLAAAADRHLDEASWLWEDCFSESGVAPAASVLAWTQTLRVGVGLFPVPLRNVALTAMELATLARLFPGRLLPGIGHGVLDWMEQVGAREASPLTLLREYGTALRRLLDGESVTTEGRYVSLDRVRLDWPPGPGTPLFVGGLAHVYSPGRRRRHPDRVGRVGGRSPTRSPLRARAGCGVAARPGLGCRWSPT